MPNQQLIDEFFSLLQSSKSFALLSSDQQEDIKQAYESATDEQYQQGLQALKKDERVVAEIEEKVKKAQAQQAEIARDIHQTLNKIKKHDLERAEAKSDAADKVKQEELLTEIDQVTDPEKEEAPKKKRKKFLGIF
jgi:hypothetical protein